MAKKEKKEKEQSSSMDSVVMWKWVYLVGGFIAAVLGLFPTFQNEILNWVLVILGFLVGLFYINTEDLTNFGVRYLLLAAVYSALLAIPAVGIYLTGFFGGFLSFLGPVALGTLVMWFWKKHIVPMMS